MANIPWLAGSLSAASVQHEHPTGTGYQDEITVIGAYGVASQTSHLYILRNPQIFLGKFENIDQDKIIENPRVGCSVPSWHFKRPKQHYDFRRLLVIDRWLRFSGLQQDRRRKALAIDPIATKLDATNHTNSSFWHLVPLFQWDLLWFYSPSKTGTTPAPVRMVLLWECFARRRRTYT